MITKARRYVLNHCAVVMLETIMGYKYVPGMAEVLTHMPGQRRRTCVDLGCGSASWYHIFHS